MSKLSLKLLCWAPPLVLLLGAPLLVGATPAALSAAWTWIGAGGDTNWANCDNWASVSIPIGEGCRPDDAGDDTNGHSIRPDGAFRANSPPTWHSRPPTWHSRARL